LKDLQNILRYVEQLQSVDTANVTSCEHVLSSIQANVFRNDSPFSTLSQETFLANAPDQIGGMIRVFPIMKLEE
jgi:aspartyl/glutamyl-tRNA(Asn/Gln) amidotransferase C subunit